MKTKEGFLLREIAGSWIVVPIGSRVVEFNGLITLSETGALLWKRLVTGAELEDLVALILSEYDIDEINATADVKEFITSVEEKGLLE